MGTKMAKEEGSKVVWDSGLGLFGFSIARVF